MVEIGTTMLILTTMMTAGLGFYVIVQGRQGWFWFKQRIPFFGKKGAFVMKFLNSGSIEQTYEMKYPEKIEWGKKEESIESIVVPRETQFSTSPSGDPKHRQFYRDKTTALPIIFVRENDTTDFDPLAQHTPQKGAKQLAQLKIATYHAGYNAAKSQFMKMDLNPRLLYAGLLIIGLMVLGVMVIAGLNMGVLGNMETLLAEIKTLIEQGGQRLA